MATTLSQGDIAVLHFQSDAPDTISFLLLADVDATTSINFTDNGVNGAGQIATGTEGTLTWTSGIAISAGTVITLSDPAGTWQADTGSVAETGNVALSATGDQVLVYQGVVAGAGDTPGLLFGAHFNSESGSTDPVTGWDTVSGTSNTSQLPASLAGFEIGFITESDNATYTGTTTGTKAELMAAITNDTNWSASNSALPAPSFAPFSVTPDDLPGTAIDDAFSVIENAIITTENVFLANPTTPDSDPDTALAVTEVESAAGSVGNQITLLSGALLQLNGDGTFVYDPNGVFEWVPLGETVTDTFIYQLTDSDTATATVTITGIDNNDTLIATAAIEAHDGGVGINTVSFENSGFGVMASLGDNTGTNGDADGDTYINIQNILGSTLNDTLTGDENDNVLDGNLGDDTLDGGDGIDTLSYKSASGDVTFSLFNPAAQATGAGGTDTALNIENLSGSDFIDTFLGDNNDNVIDGLAGDDILRGRFGNDTLNGGEGNDILVGRHDSNTLNGGVGDDLYHVNTGDTVNENGGEGYDRVSAYGDFTLTAGSEVELIIDHTGTAQRLEGNELSNAIHGHAGADTLIGNAGADTIHGGADNDIIDGGADRDIMFGGTGSDTFLFDDLSDSTHAGAGRDFIKDWSGFGGDGDQLDVSALGSAFIAGAAFSGAAGEVRFNQNNGNTHVFVDNDGDTVSDFKLTITGLHNLVVDDFVL